MQTTTIIAREGTKGILFADGSFMLTRQGIGAIVNGFYGRVYIEAQQGGTTLHCTTSLYTKGSQHVQSERKRYAVPEAGEGGQHLPQALKSDVLAFMADSTGEKPTAMHDQIHAYMYGSPTYSYQKGDIMLSPFRYDSKTASIWHVVGEAQIAVYDSKPEAFTGKSFDIAKIICTSNDQKICRALERAYSGFHSCYTKRGEDYCLRRLTWLAGCYYEAECKGEAICVYVMKPDMESPAILELQQGNVDFDDFSQDRYTCVTETRLIMALPTTDYRPEPMRVTERKVGSASWFEVETFSHATRRWIEQHTHSLVADAVADAIGWYPAQSLS